jgi:hypothetical protein
MKNYKDKFLLKSLVDTETRWLEAVAKNRIKSDQAKSQVEQDQIKRHLEAIKELSQRYDTTDWAELFLAVVDEYTEFGVGNKRGAGEKWTDTLCVMLAIEVNSKRNKNIKGGKKISVIQDLGTHPLWSKLIKPQRSVYNTFDKPYQWGNDPIHKYEHDGLLKLFNTPQWDEKLSQCIAEQLTPK